MPEPAPDENKESGSIPSGTPAHPRRRTLTPEQRRILNTPRVVSPNESSARQNAETEFPSVPAMTEAEAPPGDGPQRADVNARSRPAFEKTSRSTNVVVQTTASRAVEMRQAILILSALIVLVAIFFAGRKFDAIKYRIMSRVKAADLGERTNKYAGLSSEELVETGLAAEKRGDWQEAADRFMEAKRQNRALPGVLFRIGKTAFDRGDLAGADSAFERSIKFGENLPVANYYCGLIAVRRHDLPAATRFFEAAANAEPFVSDFYYFWGEALRLDQHPREAIHRYQQAIQRTPTTQDATLCQFKIRLARIESVEGSKVREEIEQQRKAGPLSVDWLMTEAALQLQAGEIAGAARLISEAREQGATELFLTCAGDSMFVRAAENHPEIKALIDSPAPAVVPAP